ncbi:MAG: SDR family NAD(P)-dependent oxidoreductase, partial [Rubrivivax sp.]
MDLKGKVIVVTGGGSGIGAAMLRRFSREGAAGLVVADLNDAGAQAVAAEVGGLALHVDVTQEAEVQALVERVTRHHGRIDVFCSNAGLGRGA